MNVIWLMIGVTLLLILGFVIAYFWAVQNGQFDDLETPAHRMLLEVERKQHEPGSAK